MDSPARRRWLERSLGGALALAVPAFGVRAAGPARTASPAASGEPSVWPIWPDGVPETPAKPLTETVIERSKDPAVRDRFRQGITRPVLEHFPARRPNGAAAIIIPGGGYRRIVMDKEGYELAIWLAERGVQAFVLFYRLPTEGWPSGAEAPLADAQRAMRLVRSRASELGIVGSRVAVVGYSAGGHLAANLTVRHAAPLLPVSDAVDKWSARPDFTGLIYAAVAPDRLAAAAAVPGGLFGEGTTAADLQRNSPYLHLHADAPPHFLVHAEDDPLVPVEHTLLMRSALRAQGVPVETHLYARGGHGFGLRLTQGLPVAAWPDSLLAFGRSTGWMPT